MAVGATIELEPREDPYPLSPMQRGMLLHSLRTRESGVDICQVTLDCPEELDGGTMKQAWQQLAQRHAVLRTSFKWEASNDPCQEVHTRIRVPFAQLDWRGTDSERRLEDLLHEERRQGFELAIAPLMRVVLIRRGGTDTTCFTMVWTYHHLLLDARSLVVLLQDLFCIYDALFKGELPTLPEAQPYRQHIDWLQAQDWSRAEGFWRERLKGFTAATPLVEGNEAGMQSAKEYRAGSLDGRAYSTSELTVSEAVTSTLRQRAKENGLTLNTFIQGAWALLLSRSSGEPEVVFGAVRACRRSTVDGAETMAGLFINTVPVRARITPEMKLLPWLKELRNHWVELREFEQTPLVNIQGWSEVAPGSPLFESIVNVQDPAWDARLRAQGGKWTQRRLRMINQPGYPVALDVYGGKELAIKLVHKRDRFDAGTVERLLGHFQTLLKGMAANLQATLCSLPMLSEHESHQLLVEWNQTEADLPRACAHQLFQAQAERTPDALAVSDGKKRLSFRELDGLANRLAHELRDLGVRPEARVGVLAERSIELVVGEIAISKAGGAYVPIDPAYPEERVKFVLEDAKIGILLAQEPFFAKASGAAFGGKVISLDAVLREQTGFPSTPPAGQVTPRNLAYVIYTSGSTGRPKGVEIEHASLANLIAWHHRFYEVTSSDRASMIASPAFDASVWEIWPYLTAGASLHIPKSDARLSPARLLEWIAGEKITLSFMPTPLAEAVLDEPWPKEMVLKTLLTGGDRLHRTRKQGLPCRLVNHYGPTENTVVTTACEVEGNVVGAPPIGRPIANTQIYILDETMTPVPIGAPGALHVGGIGLARGYLDRPELTAGRFIANPFDPKGRLYKTGDRARYLPDGNIEFLGRLDEQVKIRGYRIEIGEIEAIFRAHPRVREAAVIVRDEGEKQLAAYVSVGGIGSTVGCAEELRTFLEAKLPAYMVPAAIVIMDALPVTANGKVDRKALPRPKVDHECGKRFIAPRTLTEEVLAGIWSDLLHLSQVGVQDNFFRLGGHSLLAGQMVSRARTVFGVELGIETVFESPTVEALAGSIEALRGADFATTSKSPGQQTDPLPATTTPLEEWPALPKEGEILLSFAQERLWFLEQLQPGQPFNNIPAALRLKGELNVEALQRSLNELARRHQALRTAFRNQKGRATATVLPPEEIPLPVSDLCNVPASEREQEAGRLADVESREPFDLTKGRLLRCSLVRLEPEDHLLLVTTHHIASDGWSMGILYRELGALYEAFSKGLPSPLPESAVRYADFARWQQDWLRGEMLDKQLAYWKEQFKGRLPTLEIPGDRPRPPIQTYCGATHSFALRSSLHDALKKLSRQEDATLFMVLLAAFQTLLYRYSGQEDLIVGSAAAGRARAEWENIIGLFLNTLPLRTDLSGDPAFRELLKRVRKTALEAYAHQAVPLEKLVEASAVERDLSRSPLFQVMFVLQNAPFEPAEWGGVEVTPVLRGNGASKFDLTLYLEEHSDGLRGSVEYNSDLFDPSTILRMLGHFETLLEAVVENPGQPLSTLPILTEGERKQVLTEWNDTAAAFSNKCMHQIFEEQVKRTPDKIAAIFEDEELTYRQLNEEANRLAHYLRSIGAGPETRVGICMRRSLDMLVGLLGILKSGACYLPLDPAYPQERLEFMLEDSKAPVLLTEEAMAGRFHIQGTTVVCVDALPSATWQALPSTNPNSGVTPENLAYVIYTSGSTGKPKGVMICHRNVANLFTGMDERVGPEPGTWLAVTSISFDISVLELFWTLTRGFKVVIQGDEGSFRAPQRTARRPQRNTMEFSLFYFASDAGAPDSDKYRLLMEGARFADRNGLVAVWTPERHFHAFGGLYPNPAVTSAALAMVTERVQLRAGSLVLPLHNPIRVVEDWALVDNLSRGRAALSFASGWHPRDFAIAPENYANKQELMLQGIELVRKLWRGDVVELPGGTGEMVEVKVFPRPLQRDVPIWITSSGASETFHLAGEIGANLLTHLSGQSLEQLGKKIELYRAAWRQHHPDQPRGCVSLMLHTFVWDNADFVREKARGPLTEYLKTYRNLSAGGQAAKNGHSPEGLHRQVETLLSEAVDRYLDTSGLFGTPEMCLGMVEKLKAIGVDEVACLIDFGVDADLVLRSLPHLNTIRERNHSKPKMPVPVAARSLPEQFDRHRVTHLQCTPSLAAMLAQDKQGLTALRSLKKLLLGGEALPNSLVRQLSIPGQLLNMYGPTETTVWSATQEVSAAEGTVPIGRPIANTEIYIVDRHLQPAPVGIPGELLIGGAGVVRGYLNQPELTAERFIPHPFRRKPGARLYRTGDSARYLPDGRIEFLGRLDNQVKLRGFRIELGEIESALCAHPAVREGVVALRAFSEGDKRLVAYAVPQGPRDGFDVADLRNHLKANLPDYMVPSIIEVLDRLPLTPNGKVDRKALPQPTSAQPRKEQTSASAQSDAEKRIAAVWKSLLRTEQIGLHDNFFDLGGHSLLVMQVQARLSEAFHADIPMLRLFQHPTISSLARFLGETQREKVSFQKVRDRARLQKGTFGTRKPARETVA